jgi:predicted alpha/beta-fold hydrolase
MLDTTAQFIPRRFLRSGHAQTLAGNFLARENSLPAPEERLFQVEEYAQVLCHCHWQAKDRAERMTVIIVHGLEGSSESKYVIGTGSKARCAGMNVVRMNMRNCGGTEELTPTLYHSGMSGDVGAVVKSLIAEDGLHRIALVGYSMGGNLVMKLVGEWGRDGAAPPELKAVVGVSPAMDLSPSADALHLPQNRAYEWKFMRGLRRRYRRKAELYPARYARGHADATRSVREFDDVITARYSGFAGAEDYYQRASSGKLAEFITAPTLVIHSLDDPFIKMTAETRAKLVANPNVTFIETQHGGHCAFLAQANGYDGRWAERKAVEFIRRAGC